MARILAADIGGTNSRFGVFETGPTIGLTHRSTVRLKTGEVDSFPGLLDLLRKVSPESAPERCNVMVLAVPGPVRPNEKVTLANVSWLIDPTDRRLHLESRKILLINDFTAQAYSCLTELAAKARTIQVGEVLPKSCLAIIGAGTGLGHCSLIQADQGLHVPVPSENGHAAFPFIDEGEWEYARFLKSRTDKSYPDGDMVVSGPGLARLHQFLTGEILTPAEVAGKLTPHSETAAWFSRFYGRSARHYALAVLPMGGLYISGGVAQENPMLVEHDNFLEEFRDSPHYRAILEKISISLILDPENALWGAALYGLIKWSGPVESS